MKSRAYYQRSIWKYEQRREEMRKKYGPWGSGKTLQLTRKISMWRVQMRRIDKRDAILEHITEMVNEYFGVKIQSSSMDDRHKYARKIYYKYGIECRIQGVFVSNFIGRTNQHTASDSRLRFTRSFKSNPENKEAYHRFKNWIESDHNLKNVA